MTIEKYYKEFAEGKTSQEIIKTMGDVARPGSPVYEMLKEAARAKALEETKSRSKLDHPAIKMIGIIASIGGILSLIFLL